MSEQKLVELQKIIAPEVSALIESRYNILAVIKEMQPIGRRYISEILDMSERQVRNEIEFLQVQKLITVQRVGVSLTKSGQQIFAELSKLLYIFNGLEFMEQELTNTLGIKRVFIVPGDSGKNEQILRLMGQSAADYILSILGDDDVMAISGGKSTAAVSNEMREGHYPNVCIVPARGGTGRSHSIQANNVVAHMAKKLHSQYEMLHLPDNLDEDLLTALKEYPDIKRVFDKMESSSVFVFGIGKADELAVSRNLSQEVQVQLKEKNAVAEAFGHYLDIDGNVAIPFRTIGISMTKYKQTPHVVAVAGGMKKAEAIISVSRINPNLVLVTDESAAKAMLELMSNQ